MIGQDRATLINLSEGGPITDPDAWAPYVVEGTWTLTAEATRTLLDYWFQLDAIANTSPLGGSGE
jgi:hypothetical protein